MRCCYAQNIFFVLARETDMSAAYPFLHRADIAALGSVDSVFCHRHAACEGIFNARSTPIQGQDLDATSVG